MRPSSDAWSDLVSSRSLSASWITSWDLPLPRWWKDASKLSFSSANSLHQSTTPVFWLLAATSQSANSWWTFHPSLLEPLLNNTFNTQPLLPSRPANQAVRRERRLPPALTVKKMSEWRKPEAGMSTLLLTTIRWWGAQARVQALMLNLYKLMSSS